MTAALLADVADQVTDGSFVLAAAVAFLAGIVSFASPCVLPLVPGYLSFVTGLSGLESAATTGVDQEGVDEEGVDEEGVDAGADRAAVATRLGPVLVGALGFVVGFSVVFVSFGAIFGGLGQLLRDHADTLTRVFGLVTVFLGLWFMGVFSGGTWLNRDLRIHRLPPPTVWGGPLLGAAFAFGWTPCIGPTLAAVLNLAASTERASAGRGALLALFYALGLGLPFLAFALLLDRAARVSAVLRRHARRVEVVGGALLVAVGVAQLTGTWGWLVEWLQSRIDATSLPL
mgnify:CR=1 FL=1